MAIRRGKENTADLTALFFQLFTWLTLVWVLLLSATISTTLFQSLSDLKENIDSALTATAASLAESNAVRLALTEGQCSQDLMGYLDSLVANTPDLDVISIADADSIRVYHINHHQIGERFVGGDQAAALRGESYLSDGVGTLGRQRRAFCPVFGADGSVLGFVMASATTDQIDSLHSSTTHSYLRLAARLGLATLLVAGLTTLFIRRRLHGLSPDSLLHAYFTQSDVLDSLEEGVVAADRQGRVLMVNRAAERMLGQQAADLEGQPLDRLIRAEDGGSLLEQRLDSGPSSRPNILATCVPTLKDGKQTGSTLILKDKSRAMRQAEQLNGSRHIISALRANTHEFMNKLQVISGLLQIRRYDDALDYIGAISATQSELISPVLQCIQNHTVAALLLGKLTNTRELKIQMTLLEVSALPEHSLYLSTADLVTVLGNLTENAIEAIDAQTGDGPRSLVIQITEDDNGLLIMVSDTGTGIAPADLNRIYLSGYSTKAQEGRGVGMALIQEVVTRRQGSIEVDSEPGCGTTFTLIFNKKR